MLLPRDDMRQAIGFDLIEHRVQLDGKGDGDASATAAFVLLVFVHKVRFGIVRVIVVVVHHKVTIVVLGGLSGLLRLATALGTGLLGCDYVGLRRNSTGGKQRSYRSFKALRKVAQQTL